MVEVQIICSPSRDNIDKTVTTCWLEQRECVCNVENDTNEEDDTNEELLKQVGSTIYALLDEFNSMQLGVKGRCWGRLTA